MHDAQLMHHKRLMKWSGSLEVSDNRNMHVCQCDAWKVISQKAHAMVGNLFDNLARIITLSQFSLQLVFTQKHHIKFLENMPV